jgi:hypothetical protein
MRVEVCPLAQMVDSWPGLIRRNSMFQSRSKILAFSRSETEHAMPWIGAEDLGDQVSVVDISLTYM